jgi:hypothetical protein
MVEALPPSSATGLETSFQYSIHRPFEDIQDPNYSNPEVGQLDHMLDLVLVFLRNSILFFIMVTLIYMEET